MRSVTSEIAVTVFLSDLKPCCLLWIGCFSNEVWVSQTQSFSKAFFIKQFVSDIGLQDFGFLYESLPGFGIKISFASFHIVGVNDSKIIAL